MALPKSKPLFIFLISSHSQQLDLIISKPASPSKHPTYMPLLPLSWLGAFLWYLDGNQVRGSSVLVLDSFSIHCRQQQVVAADGWKQQQQQVTVSVYF